MKKLIITTTLVIVMGILMVECASTKFPQEPPKLTITIGDKQLDYIVSKNKWNGAIFDREDTFKAIMKKGSESKMPYIEIGSTATIGFLNNPPSKFTILDVLIDEKGNQRYTDKEIINIPVELKNGKCSFQIKKHMASGLSSYHVKGKTDIRGFRMTATWGKNECEYAFIISTDAF